MNPAATRRRVTQLDKHNPEPSFSLTAPSHDRRRTSREPARDAVAGAAALILVSGETAIEVLMLQRPATGDTAGSIWNFPGGRPEAGPKTGERALRASALRQLADETSIGTIDTAALFAFGRSLPSTDVPRRVETHYFLARAPAGTRPRVDGVSILDAAWLRPGHALSAAAAGALSIDQESRLQLQALARWADIAALFASAVRR